MHEFPAEEMGKQIYAALTAWIAILALKKNALQNMLSEKKKALADQCSNNSSYLH